MIKIVLWNHESNPLISAMPKRYQVPVFLRYSIIINKSNSTDFESGLDHLRYI